MAVRVSDLVSEPESVFVLLCASTEDPEENKVEADNGETGESSDA